MTVLEDLERLRKDIAFHSLLYYDFDTTVISDREYDELVFELSRKSLEADYEGIDGWHFDEFMDYWESDDVYTSGFSLKCKYDDEIIERAKKAFDDGILNLTEQEFNSKLEWILAKRKNYAS